MNSGSYVRTSVYSRRRVHPSRGEGSSLLRKNNVFSCPNQNCHSTFVWKRNLLSHLRYQCGKAPKFKCPYCDYKCKVRAGIRRHIKYKHKNHEIFVVDMTQPWIVAP